MMDTLQLAIDATEAVLIDYGWTENAEFLAGVKVAQSYILGAVIVATFAGACKAAAEHGSHRGAREHRFCYACDHFRDLTFDGHKWICDVCGADADKMPTRGGEFLAAKGALAALPAQPDGGAALAPAPFAVGDRVTYQGRSGTVDNIIIDDRQTAMWIEVKMDDNGVVSRFYTEQLQPQPAALSEATVDDDPRQLTPVRDLMPGYMVLRSDGFWSELSEVVVSSSEVQLYLKGVPNPVICDAAESRYAVDMRQPQPAPVTAPALPQQPAPEVKLTTTQRLLMESIDRASRTSRPRSYYELSRGEKIIYNRLQVHHYFERVNVERFSAALQLTDAGRAALATR